MTDRLVELEGLLEALPAAVDQRRLGDRLHTSMETLQTAERSVERIEAIVDLAALLDLDSTGQGHSVAKVRQEALEVGEWLETAATDQDLRDAVHEYKEGLLRSLSATELAVRAAWAAFAAQKFRPLVALGQLLQSINVEAELGASLVETGQRAIKPREGVSAKALAQEVRTLLAEQTTLQDERAKLISEGAIGQFITALAEQKATLAMVTPDVRAWLEQNGALERFSLMPRSTGIAGANAG